MKTVSSLEKYNLKSAIIYFNLDKNQIKTYSTNDTLSIF